VMRLPLETLRRLVDEGRLPASVLPEKTGKIAGFRSRGRGGRKRAAVCPINPYVDPRVARVPGGVRITFPFPLPRRNTTQSKNWRATATRNREVKATVCHFLALLRPPTFRVPVTLTYTVYTPRLRDSGNVDEKYATDALVACSVIPDD